MVWNTFLARSCKSAWYYQGNEEDFETNYLGGRSKRKRSLIWWSPKFNWISMNFCIYIHIYVWNSPVKTQICKIRPPNYSHDRNDASQLLLVLLIFIRPDLSERTQSMPRHSLMVLSTICASVAAAPNSSEACLATSLRPTSKASNALVTWPCSRNATNFGVWCISMHFPQICQRNSLQRVGLPIYIV